jgi:hypothetical protein
MLKLSALILSAVLLAGCAHTVSLHPELADIAAPAAAKPSPRRVAFYLAESTRNTTVTTPGGGGDSVTYKPYEELEVALIKMLKNTFASAIRMNEPPDSQELKRRNIDYVVTALITTNSSSPKSTMWAPTEFTLKLQLQLVDTRSGAVVLKEVVGHGKFDHAARTNPGSAPHGSQAPRQAALAALLQMQRTLLDAPELR